MGDRKDHRDVFTVPELPRKCDGGPRFTDWSEYDGQPKEPKRLCVPRVLRFLRALLEGARPDGEQED